MFLLGRLNKARKVDTLLRALARARTAGLECSLVIVGDGSERRPLEELAQSLGLNDVHFDGPIYDERELARYFLICDVFVTPGVASLATKMAMTFGPPGDHASTTASKLHDIVDGVNGFLFPMDDDVALAARIREVLSSDERRRDMGREALRTIRERVNINRMITGFRLAISGKTDDDRPAGRHPPGQQWR